MTSTEQLRLWTASRLDIASCRKCLDRWPSRIDQTLRADEIPNPSREISILFVGVAPPPLGRKDSHEAGHSTRMPMIGYVSACLMFLISYLDQI